MYVLPVRVPRHPIRGLRYRLRDPKHLFLRRLPDDAVIVEAGAHRGDDTVRLADRFPRGHIHAFEPIPDLYDAVVRRTTGHPNVTAYPLALSTSETTQAMWVSGGAGDASSSILAPKRHLDVYPDVTFASTVNVNATSLSSWAHAHGVDRVDGMWLDMQGHELAALKAAGRLLRTTRAVLLEVSAVELYEGCPLWPEVRAWLRQAGFRIRAVRWDQARAYGDARAIRRR